MTFYTSAKTWGNSILVREVTGEGRRNVRVPYAPTLFTLCQKETEYTNLDGKYVAPVKFDSIKEAKEFLQNYESQPHLVFGLDQFQFAYIAEKYPKEIDFDFDKILWYSLDIECESENGFPEPTKAEEPILSITIKNHTSNKIYVWGRDTYGKYKTDRQDVFYKNCKTEEDLLLSFLDYWEKFTPDFITGWSIDDFDMPYIYNRINNVLGDKVVKKLSPWGDVRSYIKEFMGKKTQKVDILGVEVLDYLNIYKKFILKKQESYSLDFICNYELGKKKDKNPYSTFSDWYKNDWQSFIDYNIMDVELVDMLEDKLKLLELVVTMAYEAKVNYSDVYSPTKVWDVIIYNFLYQNKIVIPQKSNSRKDYQFEGAYVKIPVPGRYSWTVSFDLDSLYPHLIMMYNISPETLLQTLYPLGHNVVERMLRKEIDLSALKEQKITVTPNGAAYMTDHIGFLPILMKKMYDERKVFKKKSIESKKKFQETGNTMFKKYAAQYDNIQKAKKTLLVSAYGAIGNENFRYFDIRNAEAVTLSGQLSIQWIERDMNNYMNKVCGTSGVDYIIASDTDSLYVNFDAFVEKMRAGRDLSTDEIVDFLDKITATKFQEVIDKSFTELSEYVNAHTQAMKMKRENIADAAIWTAKKRYILNVWDSEGVRYKEPDLKITGIEAIKSSTPASCRDKIIEGIKVILKSDEKAVNDFIQTYRKEFLTLDVDLISFPRSVGNLNKFKDSKSIFKKGTPMHMKGAILYNFLLKDKGLGHKYPAISGGDKIKFIYLRPQNPYNCNVIAYKTALPEELDIVKYIDRETQFDKAFADPFALITHAIKMDIDREYGTKANLNEFLSDETFTPVPTYKVEIHHRDKSATLDDFF